jgi:hypothetical protein
MPSLKLWHRNYFESILNMTSTVDDLTWSLFSLSYYLAKKFNQKVIVLIDEYDAPNNHAYDHGYANDVRPLYPSLPPLGLRTSIPGQ